MMGEPEQGITKEKAFELATDAERPILETLMRGGPIATNRFRLQASQEITNFLSRREDAARAETWKEAIMFVNIADIGDAKGADATYKIGKMLEAAAESKTKVEEDEQKNLG